MAEDLSGHSAGIMWISEIVGTASKEYRNGVVHEPPKLSCFLCSLTGNTFGI
ncbi:unnamed protein product [Calypogeia fissa]